VQFSPKRGNERPKLSDLGKIMLDWQNFGGSLNENLGVRRKL
jgi:hypothetical protein